MLSDTRGDKKTESDEFLEEAMPQLGFEVCVGVFQGGEVQGTPQASALKIEQ